MKGKVKSYLFHVSGKIPLWLTKINILFRCACIWKFWWFSRKIMNTANCRSSTVNQSTKDNINFAQPDLVYKHITKPNKIRDSNVRQLTSLPLPIGYGLPYIWLPIVQASGTVLYRVNFVSSTYEHWWKCVVWRQRFTVPSNIKL